jgi:hypothetical protein
MSGDDGGAGATGHGVMTGASVTLDLSEEPTLRIFQMTSSTSRHLCLMVPTSIPSRFGCYYIQFPERGEPGGGSCWSWDEERFHEPREPDEITWAVLYLTAKKVRRLKDELAKAEEDAAATRKYAELTGVLAPTTKRKGTT